MSLDITDFVTTHRDPFQPIYVRTIVWLIERVNKNKAEYPFFGAHGTHTWLDHCGEVKETSQCSQLNWIANDISDHYGGLVRSPPLTGRSAFSFQSCELSAPSQLASDWYSLDAAGFQLTKIPTPSNSCILVDVWANHLVWLNVFVYDTLVHYERVHRDHLTQSGQLTRAHSVTFDEGIFVLFVFFSHICVWE